MASSSPSIGEGGVELRRVLGPDEALLGRDFFEPLHQAKEAARDRLAEEEEDGGEGDKSRTIRGEIMTFAISRLQKKASR